MGDLFWALEYPRASTNRKYIRRSLSLVRRCDGTWRVMERLDDLNYRATHIRTGVDNKLTVDFVVPANYPAESSAPDADYDPSSEESAVTSDEDDPDWTEFF